MNVTARDAEETRRLALALLLALGLHAGLLLGVPTEDWSLHQSRPLRFDVVLLPTLAQPEGSAPLTAIAPGSPELPVQPNPVVAGAVSEPVLPPPESLSAPSPSPPPAFVPPSPSIPPPQPVVVTSPAPKVTLTQPPVAKTITPLPRTPVKPAKPTQGSASPGQPTTPPRQAARTPPSNKPPAVKPSPAPMEISRPSIAPPAARKEQPGHSRTGKGASGRLDSAALLSQIAGLDTETQRRAGSDARERRVNLADTRSLAGFYAADWARKVTRVGEMNFPEAARRLNPGTGPLLDVAIRSDGSLRNVRVLRSSGNAELDQAARRIVQLAAPYPPFPPELRQQVEVLRIEAPWRFDPGGRVQVR